MPKIFKCQTCGLDKTLESKKKDGSTFMSCPNWKDQQHTQARLEWKKVNQQAPAGTYNAPQQNSFATNPDVYNVLTDINVIVKKIWDKLNSEMPSEEEF